MFKYKRILSIDGCSTVSRFTNVLKGSKLCVLFIFILATQKLYGQTTQKGTVKLKSGVIMTGEVLEVEYADYVKMVFHRDTAFIEWTDIESLEMLSESPITSQVAVPYRYAPRPRKKPQPYKPNKMYITVDMANRLGYEPWLVLNPGFSLAVGYNLTEHMGVGGCIGSDFYWGNNSNVFPTGVEVDYKFNKSGFSPQLKFRTGYNFANGRPSWWGDQVEVTEGGFFFNPAVGIISKKREHMAWYLNLNTMIANIREQGTRNVFDGRQWTVVPVDIQRNLVRTGLTFGFYFD